jgi:hypothetical protein
MRSSVRRAAMTYRTAVRHGHEDGRPPSAADAYRSSDRGRGPRTASEVPLATYQHFADRDALSRVSADGLLGARVAAGAHTGEHPFLRAPTAPPTGRSGRRGRGASAVQVALEDQLEPGLERDHALLLALAWSPAAARVIIRV